MSSPFDTGRDSTTGGFGFGEEADVADSEVGTFDSFARAMPSDRLGEDDYREGDQRP